MAFPKSSTRTTMTQHSHFIASIMAYVKLKRLKIRCSKNHFVLKTHAGKRNKSGMVYYAKNYLSEKPFKIGIKMRNISV